MFVKGNISPSYKLHVEDGSTIIGDISYISAGLGTANGHKLIFDNTYNGTAGSGNICNKLLLHNTATLNASFGIEDSALTYQSGIQHRFYTGTTSTAYGTNRFNIYGSGVNVTGDYYDDGRIIQDHLFNNTGRTHGSYTNFISPTDFACYLFKVLQIVLVLMVLVNIIR